MKLLNQNMKSYVALILSLLVFMPSTVLATARNGAPPIWSYDSGPLNTPMGKELIDINSRIPFMPGISMEILGEQKFRPAFGPIPWRMRQKPNSVKILFIGQDGTHIAEAAGRPATASFGGRAQDLANYFGVDESAAFMNAYSFTIKGQYGSFAAPVLATDSGKKSIRYTAYVDNKLWLMTQDQESPITQWRNDLIDWILRNNRDSIRLIVLFGGAARDAAGAFITSRYEKVGSRTSPVYMKNLQVPEIKIMPAGSNNEFAVPLTAEGKDLYEQLVGKKLEYSKEDKNKEKVDQVLAQKTLSAKLEEAVNQMVFSKGGPYSNGVLDAAQLGGYDLTKMEIAGEKTISIKGLRLSDDSVIDHDVLVVQLPHPSALSKMTKQKASEAVGLALKAFDPYVKKGWEIDADPGMKNKFVAKEKYEYARADIGPEYYDFGAPASRMVSVSDASRMDKNPQAIIFGTRDKANFDMNLVKASTEAKPSNMPKPNEMYTSRARLPETRYVFDSGPGEKYAKIMKENLDLAKIFAEKSGKCWDTSVVPPSRCETEAEKQKIKELEEKGLKTPKRVIKDGIAAFNIKSHPDNLDYGHYRGTFKDPKVIILADPDGYDDLATARALTGTRGQYLQGLMNDLGVNDKYLVIKTVPFGMDGADVSEWHNVLSATEDYRKNIITAVLTDSLLAPDLILSDGEYAAQELKRILGEDSTIPVINIMRNSAKKDAGIAEAGKAISKLPAFEGVKISGKMVDIPRSHLSYYARLWEGTSGDRVLNSTDKYKGKAFAVIAPSWAWKQKVSPSKAESSGIDKLKRKLEDNGLPKARETIPDFVKRKKNNRTELSYLEAKKVA